MMVQRPEIPAGLPDDIEDKKWAAKTWFESLRDNICAAFEHLEHDGPDRSKPAGHFKRTPWHRDNGAGGGGVMSMMARPRSSRRSACMCSTVYGEFSPEFAQERYRGAEDDPQAFGPAAFR
jgi:coproporphyrinogen III oxidase